MRGEEALRNFSYSFRIRIRHLSFSVICLLAVFYCCSALHCAEDNSAAQPGIAEFIRQLGNENFDTRESAMAGIQKLGEETVPALRVALENTQDLEIRGRLKHLIDLWPLGGIVWTSDAGVFFGLPVVVGKRVFVTNKDSNVYCLDADNGAEIWSLSTEDLMYHSIAVCDGRVFVIRTRKEGRKDGTLFCLSASDGKIQWKYKFDPDSQTFTAPICTPEQLFISCDDTLYCMNPADGAVEWRFQAPSTFLSAPSVSAAAGMVLIGCLDQKLYCVDCKTGKKIWEFQTEGSVYAGAAISEGRAYLGSHDHYLYSLDLTDGTLLWRFQTGGCITGAPAVASGKVFTGSDDGSFYCLDAKEGKRLWQFQTAGNVFTSPACCDGKVFVSSLSTKLTLYCLDAEDGKVNWTFETKEGGYACPVLAGRRLFVGYHSKFYCVRTGLKGPENWPMLGGNAARTGCYERGEGK